MIYVIRDLKDGVNLVYVETREEAVRICGELPGVFTWEPLQLFRGVSRLQSKYVVCELYATCERRNRSRVV
jgi:hypothetical protein